MSAPSTFTHPAVGATRPMIMPMVVVLPAPLPPSKPVTEPCASENEMPRHGDRLTVVLGQPLGLNGGERIGGLVHGAGRSHGEGPRRKPVGAAPP